MSLIRLGSISIDCSNVHELISFYSRLMESDVGFENEEFAAIKIEALWLSVHRVEQYEAPSWPDSLVPKQIHLNFAVDNLDEAERFALSVGATKMSEQPNPDSWRVLCDLAGHPFCLTRLIPE